MEKCLKNQDYKIVSKELEMKHLGEVKKMGHKRRRSQPIETENPDKFDQMFEKHLQHYNKILIEGNQTCLSQKDSLNLNCQVAKKQKRQQEKAEQEPTKQNGIRKDHNEEENSELMSILKGLNMDSELLAEVLSECKKVSKQC